MSARATVAGAAKQEVQVNGLAADKISHFSLQVPFHFHHSQLPFFCLMVNNVMFVSRGRMFHSTWNKRKEKKGKKKSFSDSWRTGTPGALFDEHGHERGGNQSVVFEEKTSTEAC